ncbi:AMP-binding protein [Treponema primitia]|uniref:AMP-binding protein n=1 Tax=Treponema primitia TaxID=88058 RepID=UPI00397EB5B8
MTDTHIPTAFSLSRFTPSSRPGDTVLCYEGSWQGGPYKTWSDFLGETAAMRRIIEADAAPQWILHCEDLWYFLIAFTALLQCRKTILLTANISPGYIAEIRAGGADASPIPFLTDQDIPSAAGDPAGQTIYVPALLAGPFEAKLAAETPPVIIADETVIMMYTSGTTGRPKVVQQRLTEFEIDNVFILSKWGEEFQKRKLVSTVSQHHIYGLLFSILLPFTTAVPFRRNRIEYPEEFETLAGGSGGPEDSYMIITVPAFLKRSVERENAPSFNLRSPWIFTSGGVLLPELAKRTDEVFGFWPLEVYGSTETSGIAYRQSRDGLQWTPFDNCKVRLNEEGCLVIQSPYIKDTAGFTTGDLADILEDGRFILKGRADSIVKIEGKRISLPELESRLLQSGLVSDVCVVPLEDHRQYLGAALVFNREGQEKFRTTEKYLVNRYFHEYLRGFFENTVIPRKWRYPDSLPLDAQGKKKRNEIQALFAGKPESIKPGFLIPVYNHGRTLAPIVEQLYAFGLPIILIDDGSDGETKKYLAKLTGDFPETVLLTLEKNRGKGAAVSAGIEKAHELALTHVLQIDADGQHDISRAGFFLEQSRLHPEALICGYPEFDESVPASRRKGRRIANTWVGILTLSRDITDAMCGFRVYPVKPFWEICRRHHLDQRMGFDIEVLILFYWKGFSLLFHPVTVGYPRDGVSNFHMVRDNIRISWMFTRRFFGMIPRLPRLIRRRKEGLDGKGEGVKV